MNATPSLTRLWFMDWHGRVLSHDPIRDDFSQAPFEPGIHPSLSAQLPVPLHLPCSVALEKRVSMPRPLPRFEMQAAPNGLVCFQVEDKGTYLKSARFPQGGEVVATSPQIAQWEYFLPMSENFLRGLSALLVPQAATLTNPQTGEAFSVIQLHSGFIGEINGKRLSLVKNTSAIEQLGSLAAGQTADISFQEEDHDTPLIIRVQRPG